MWQPGDVITWRGILRRSIWHAQPTIIVQDSPTEIVMALLPGTECIADENCPKGKQNNKPKSMFKDNDWKLAKYTWRTNRLLLIFEPEKFYSTMLFWNDASHEFLCYYINFQLPFQRGHNNLDMLDVDLDLIIRPDFKFEWKDEEAYQKAIDHGLVSPAWVEAINDAKPEIFDRLEKRQDPFDGSWLDWIPDATWTRPTLPKNRDRI